MKMLLVALMGGVAGFLLAWFGKPATAVSDANSGTGGSGPVRLQGSSNSGFRVDPIEIGNADYFALSSDRKLTHAGDGSIEQIELWSRLHSGLTAERAPELFAKLAPLASQGKINEELWRSLTIRMGELAGRQIADTFERGAEKPAFGLESIVQGWSRNSPDEALEWSANLKPGHYRNQVSRGLFRGLMSNDPSSAAGVFLRQPMSGSRRENQFVYVDALRVEKGYAASLAEFYKLGEAISETDGEDNARRQVESLVGTLNGAAKKLPWKDRAEALLAVSDHPFFPESAWNSALKQGQWQDTAEVLDWVSDPDQRMNEDTRNRVRSAALNAIFGNRSVFGDHIPVWMAENREHPIYDDVVVRFVHNAGNEDPDGAVQWADTIKDESVREETKAMLEAIERSDN